MCERINILFSVPCTSYRTGNPSLCSHFFAALHLRFGWWLRCVCVCRFFPLTLAHSLRLAYFATQKNRASENVIFPSQIWLSCLEIFTYLISSQGTDIGNNPKWWMNVTEKDFVWLCWGAAIMHELKSERNRLVATFLVVQKNKLILVFRLHVNSRVCVFACHCNSKKAKQGHRRRSWMISVDCEPRAVAAQPFALGCLNGFETMPSAANQSLSTKNARQAHAVLTALFLAQSVFAKITQLMNQHTTLTSNKQISECTTVCSHLYFFRRILFGRARACSCPKLERKIKW